MEDGAGKLHRTRRPVGPDHAPYDTHGRETPPARNPGGFRAGGVVLGVAWVRQLHESPHAHEPVALGLSMVKPCFSMVSTKSMDAPST